MVRLHGQPKFLLHDGIAAGIFNSIYNGASAGFVPWDAALQNNNGVLGLLLNRMKKDFEGLTPKMRKPWGQKELEHLQRICGAYKACFQRFKDLVPSTFFDKVKDEIESTFLHRHADGDLASILVGSVPPPDLNKVSMFAAHLAKYQQEAEDLKAERAAELSAALLQTTWNQTELGIQNDLLQLKQWASQFHLFASQQGGLDMQYLSNRYMRGKDAVAQYMSGNHNMFTHKSIVLAHGSIVEKQAALGPSTCPFH